MATSNSATLRPFSLAEQCPTQNFYLIASNKKVNPVVDTIGEAINIPTLPPPPGSEVSGAVEQSVGLDRNLVSDLTKSGLPFLWNCDRSTNAPSYASPNSQPRCGEVREAPLLVKVGLPFLWGGDIGRGNVQDCELYLQGICPGKTNGGCQRLHRKRCSKFMKWGNKGENGCKVVHCDRVHPTLCIRSLDLKCLVKDCSAKLHTFKCKRLPTPPEVTKGGGVHQQGAGAHSGRQGSSHVHQQGAGGVQGGQGYHQGHVWAPEPGGRGRAGGGQNQGFGERPGQAGGYHQGVGHHMRAGPQHAAGDRPPQSQFPGAGNRRGSEFPGNRGMRRENPQQDFQVVTAQQLLGAIQEMVRQVLGQGHHLPEQCLGDRPSF